MTNNFNKDELNIKETVKYMHLVAESNPEILDSVATDEHLCLAIVDLDSKMKIYLGFYMAQKECVSSSVFSYEKQLNKNIMDLYGCQLLSYYELYKAYEPLIEDRNLKVKLDTDVNFVNDLLIKDGLLEETIINHK